MGSKRGFFALSAALILAMCVQTLAAPKYSDVSESHWAYDDIISAYVKGWISGYPGGEFKPGNSITRAEVVKIVNYIVLTGYVDIFRINSIMYP